MRLRDILGELEERGGPAGAGEQKRAKQYLQRPRAPQVAWRLLWVDTVQKARDTVREQQRKLRSRARTMPPPGGRSRPFDARTESTLRGDRASDHRSRPLQREIRSHNGGDRRGGFPHRGA